MHSVDSEEDGSGLPSSTSVDQWSSRLTSTPCKEKSRSVSLSVLAEPVSPIPAHDSVEEKKPCFQVTVEWLSRTTVNTLHEGLEWL